MSQNHIFSGRGHPLKNPRFAFIFCAVLVLCLFVVFASRNEALSSSEKSAVDMTGRDVVTITQTAEGFSPREISVTRGTTIRFVSNAERPFWPASDVHPLHTIYPEFDPQRPLRPDEEWTFIFEKEGRWLFHDHLSPTARGVIHVLAPGTSPRDTRVRPEDCEVQEGDNKRSCWSEQMMLALETEGLESALETLRSFRELDPMFAYRCHSLVHDLGVLTYQKYGSEPPLPITTGYCNDGFYHGFMEAFVIDQGDLSDLLAFCDRVDKTFHYEYPLAYLQCAHGIGHGTAEKLLSTRSDLTSDLAKIAEIASGECTEAFGNTRYRYRCFSGFYEVLVDWIAVQNGGEKLKRSTEPIALCSEEKDPLAKEGCLMEFSNRSMWLADDFAGKALALAEVAGQEDDERYRIRMLRMVGNIAAKRMYFGDDSKIIEFCRIFPDEKMSEYCLQGVIGGLFLVGVPGEEHVRLLRFCHSAHLSRIEKEQCADETLTTIRESYAREKVPLMCTALTNVVGKAWKECSIGSRI